MRNNNKKGFTLVELVIVIAVIAILAAVLIPTFVTVIANANKSAALQEATNLRDQISIIYAKQGGFDAWCEDVLKITEDNTNLTEISSGTATIKDKNVKLLFGKLYEDLKGDYAEDEILTFGDVISDATSITVKTEKVSEKDVYYITYDVGKYTVKIYATEIKVDKKAA